MGLKSTRRILSIVFSVILAFSLFVSASCIMSNLTVSNRDFYEKQFANEKITSECNRQLDDKLKTLAKKSNIPFEVFESVKKQYNTSQSLEQAASYLFDENDSTLNNEVRLKYFYDICTEYLDANGYDYSTDAVYNACVEAAQIYSDTVGIHNLEYLNNDISARRTSNTKKISIFLLASAICIVLTLYMYKKKTEGMIYVSSGIIGGGIAGVISFLLQLAFKVGTSYDFEPLVYSNVFGAMYKTYLVDGALACAVLTLIGFAVLVVTVKIIDRDEFRKNTRFFKVVDKL